MGPSSIFQGKDPKIEEFIPPGWYRNISGDLWAMPRVWMVDGELGDSGEQEVKWKDPSLLSPDEDCPLKEASSRKIPRLTVKVRKEQLLPCRQNPSPT